jgi:diacylglycerol kinase family enzyme
LPKGIAFFRAALATLRRFPFVNVRLLIAGREFRRRTPFVFVGNNVYRVKGIGLGSRDSLTGGVLFLGVARRPIGRWGLFRLALRSLIGRIHDERDVDFLETKELDVLSRRKHLRVSLDGEVLRLRTPLHYRTRSGALKVIAP